MAREPGGKPHYLREHLAVRPAWNAAGLARALGTSDTNVSRWLSENPDKSRGLKTPMRQRIETLWGLPRGALLNPPGKPEDTPREAFLAGLTQDNQAKITEYRDLLRAQQAAPRRRRRA